MKSNLLLGMFALSALFACSSDDPQPELVAQDGELVARVEAATWKSSQATALFRDNYLSINAIAEDGSHIALGIKGSTAGTYQLETEPEGSAVLINLASYTPANASLQNATYSSVKGVDASVGGTITITEFDTENKLVSGRFDVRLSRSKLNNDGTSTDPPQDEVITVKGSFTKIIYTNTIVGPASNTGSAKVNGSAFAPTAVGGAKNFGKLVLSLSNNGTQTISIQMPENISVGSFELGGFAFDDYSAVYSPTTSQMFDSSNGGTLTISKHDTAAKRIEGTFNFNAASFPMGGATTYTVTEGRFAITYQ